MGMVSVTVSPTDREKAVWSVPSFPLPPEAQTTRVSPGARTVPAGNFQREGFSALSERYQPSRETEAPPAL